MDSELNPSAEHAKTTVEETLDSSPGKNHPHFTRIRKPPAPADTPMFKITDWPEELTTGQTKNPETKTRNGTIGTGQEAFKNFVWPKIGSDV